MKPRRTGGFTLIELLAVVALAAVVIAVAVTALGGRGSGAARDAAVLLLATKLGETRTLALSRGEPARLMVRADPADAASYLRFVVSAVPDGAGWRAYDDGCLLPAGQLLLPPDALTPVGPGAIRRADSDWSRGSGGALRSTALRTLAASGGAPEFLGSSAWLVVHFSPTGGALGGQLVVARGRPVDGSSPVTVLCEDPDDVAGLSLSANSVATVLHGRAEF
ncbi:MAG TPA: prepilin-type N-terminal cleavage/methylation domain-containing protein [Opitutaceae bacterium]|nr:prepilin-type N-terminal cleavage/methylation domain-containing protein [Opitutaceae bacterium]